MNVVLDIQNVQFDHKIKEIKLTQKHMLQIQNMNHQNKTEVKQNG